MSCPTVLHEVSVCITGKLPTDKTTNMELNRNGTNLPASSSPKLLRSARYKRLASDAGFQKNSDTGSLQVASTILSSKSPKVEVLQHHNGMSINFVLVCLFVLSVLLLGAGLIIISGDYSFRAQALQGQVSQEIQNILLGLLNESNSDLQHVTNESVDQLIQVILDQVYRRAGEALDNYTRWCKFSVLEQADAWSGGELDPYDLDRTRTQQWKILLRFTSISMVNFADQKRGSYVGIQRLPQGGYDLLIKNSSGTKCLGCLFGASGNNLYYYTLSEPFQETGWALEAANPYDPRIRPWYAAAIAGNGSGRWSEVYTFTGGSTVAMTAVKAVKSRDGATLGVVGSDLSLEFISQFLREMELHLLERLGGSAQRGGLHLAAVDRHGRMLGASTNDSIVAPVGGAMTQLAWADAIATPLLRAGIQAVSDHWGADWAAACAASSPAAAAGGAYQTYSRPGLLVASSPYGDSWGLRLVLITVVAAAEYRAGVDAAMDRTLQRIANESAATAQLIAAAADRVNRDLRANQMTQICVSVGVVVAGSLLVNLVALRITEPLRRLAASMERVAVLDFTPAGDGGGGGNGAHRALREVETISRSFRLMATNLRSFARYVPESVVRLLTHRGAVARLGVEPREVTVVFSDIVGFTSVTEALPPPALIGLLAEYLEEMSNLVEESEGTVGKYIGDAIMAFWNSPAAVEDHAAVAVGCALDQQARLVVLRGRWEAAGLPPLAARIGVSTGMVLHGNIGSSCRLEWGLIGDEVNLAARLEAMCKEYGVSILISGSTHRLVEHTILCRPVDRVRAYGKTVATDIYEPVARRADATAEQRRFCADFEELVAAYRRGEFVAARAAGEALLERYPGDYVAGKYVERCDHWIAEPPGPEWQATFTFTSK